MATGCGLVTLHGYILREVLKTFLLTLAGLTVLFTMGGGLFNVVRQEGVTTTDFLRFVPLLIPIVVTLTMPVAALFAVTITYGRLAADNELTACRAAGINVHRLLGAVFLLAVFVSLFTLVFGNYVIPHFMHRLEQFARSNLRDIAFQQLRSKGYARWQTNWFITAEDVPTVSAQEAEARGYISEPGVSHLFVQGPTCLQLSDGKPVRFTTADWGVCVFDTRGEGIDIQLQLLDARDVEVDKRAVELKNQVIRINDLPLRLAQRLSSLDLETLLLWQREPWRQQKVGERVARLQAEILAHRFARYATDRLTSGGLVLVDDLGQEYEIQARESLIDDRSRPLLMDVQVRLSRVSDNGQRVPLRRYQAPRASLIVREFTAPSDPKSWERSADSQIVEIYLQRTDQQPVLEFDAGATQARTKPSLSLDREPYIPDVVLSEVAELTAPRLLDPNAALGLPPELEDSRAGVRREADRQLRKINATLHFRHAFPASALVTLFLGAALGIVFRGARALAAFGLACVPFGVVLILMLMGRQLSEGAGTENIGPWVTWGGLGLVALVDMVVIWLGVRR